MRPEVSTQDDAVRVRAGDRELASLLGVEIASARQGVLADDEDLLGGNALLQSFDTPAKREPNRQPSQPLEPLPEQRNRPAVFAQAEGFQQRADAIEQDGGGVLLEREMLNPSQDESILAEGELVAFLRRVGDAEPEVGADPKRPRGRARGSAVWGARR